MGSFWSEEQGLVFTVKRWVTLRWAGSKVKLGSLEVGLIGEGEALSLE